jgi:hypothetical protein
VTRRGARRCDLARLVHSFTPMAARFAGVIAPLWRPRNSDQQRKQGDCEITAQAIEFLGRGCSLCGNHEGPQKVGSA